MHLFRISTVLAALASPVLAEAPRFDVSGDLGLYSFHQDGESQFYALGDVDVALGFGKLGAELSVISLAFESTGRNAIFGGLTWTFDNGGRLVVGAPQPAYDRFGSPQLERASRVNGLLVPTGGLGFLSFAELESDVDDYGIRYDSPEDGSLSYSISAHGIAGEDLAILTGAVRYESGPWVAEAGLEVFEGPTYSRRVIKTVTRRDFGMFTAGLWLSTIESGGSAMSYAELSATAAASDALELGLSAGQIIDGPLRVNLYSAFADYQVRDGLSARFGVMRNEATDTHVELGLKMTF